MKSLNNKYFLILIILIFLISMSLSFHYYPEKRMIFPKNNLTFSHTIILNKDIDELIIRYNNAGLFEKEAIKNEPFFRKLAEKKIIFELNKNNKKEKNIRLEDKINFLKKETVPIRFKILEKNIAYITFAIKFYDQDSVEFNADTLKIQGQKLVFIFNVIPVKKDFNIAFPVKIFTNKMPAKEGVKLFNYYDDHGFPQTMTINGADEDYINLMTKLFGKIKNGKTEDIKGIYGSMVQDIAKLNEFQVNHIYKIVIHSKGGIEVTEDI